MKLRTEKATAVIEKIDGKDKAVFHVNLLTPKEQAKMVDQVLATKGRRSQETDSESLYKLKISRINKTIFDWDGIEDMNGKPIECNLENKEIVYNYNRDLIDEVLDEADRLSDIRNVRKEEERKNSDAGQNG